MALRSEFKRCAGLCRTGCWHTSAACRLTPGISSLQGRIPSTTLQCIRLLRTTLPQARVSVEIEKPGRDGLPELAAQADVVFFSRAWAEVMQLTTAPLSNQSRLLRSKVFARRRADTIWL